MKRTPFYFLVAVITISIGSIAFAAPKRATKTASTQIGYLDTETEINDLLTQVKDISLQFFWGKGPIWSKWKEVKSENNCETRKNMLQGLYDEWISIGNRIGTILDGLYKEDYNSYQTYVIRWTNDKKNFFDWQDLIKQELDTLNGKSEPALGCRIL